MLTSTRPPFPVRDRLTRAARIPLTANIPDAQVGDRKTQLGGVPVCLPVQAHDARFRLYDQVECGATTLGA